MRTAFCPSWRESQHISTSGSGALSEPHASGNRWLKLTRSYSHTNNRLDFSDHRLKFSYDSTEKSVVLCITRLLDLGRRISYIVKVHRYDPCLVGTLCQLDRGFALLRASMTMFGQCCLPR